MTKDELRKKAREFVDVFLHASGDYADVRNVLLGHAESALISVWNEAIEAAAQECKHESLISEHGSCEEMYAKSQAEQLRFLKIT